MPAETTEPTPDWCRPLRLTSARTLFGMPLYDIVIRPEPYPAANAARGVVAVGNHARGVFAFGGGTARGVVACAGGAALGVFAYAGGISAGLVAASGGAALGVLALAGGASAGVVAGSGGFTAAVQQVMTNRGFFFPASMPGTSSPGTSVPWWFIAVVFMPMILAIVALVRARLTARREFV